MNNKDESEKILDELLTNRRIAEIVHHLAMTKDECIAILPVLIAMTEEEPATTRFLLSVKRDEQGKIHPVRILSDFGATKAFLQNIISYDLQPIDFELERKYIASESNKVLTSAFTNLRKDLLTHERPLGLYVYGAAGVGKTFLLKRFSRKLATDGFKVAFFTLPTIFAAIKRSFGNASWESGDLVEEVINLMVKADLLVLDDLGGETIAPWFRDEILYVVLAERLSRRALTFFSSSYDFNELAKVEARIITRGATPRSNNDERVQKLMDKITSLAKPFALKGSNRYLNER